MSAVKKSFQRKSKARCENSAASPMPGSPSCNDKRGNDYLAAAVETTRARADIEQELLKTLPAWKLPKTWLIAPALSRSDRGKLHTTELRARLSVKLP